MVGIGSNIGNNIRKIMAQKRITARELSAKTGVSPTHISYVINNRRSPSIELLEKIADVLNVTVSYLTGSVSSIIKERLEEIGMALPELAEKSQVPAAFIQNVDSIVPDHEVDGGEQCYSYLNSIAWILGIPPSKLRVTFALQEIPTDQYPQYRETPEEAFVTTLEETNLEAYPVGKMVKVPIIGTVTAGPNGLAYEDYQGEEQVDTSYINGDHLFYLRVKGDSMIGEGILPGDLALVRETPEVEYGALAIAIVNGEEGTIKRVYKNGDSIILQASNPKYPPLIFKGEEMKNIRIVGEVKMTTRRY